MRPLIFSPFFPEWYVNRELQLTSAKQTMTGVIEYDLSDGSKAHVR